MKQKTVHATLVHMMSRGIVLMGESGSGKSRLALSLLYEGARLVADDVVEILDGPGGLRGRAPDRLRGLMEVRGVGIIDVTEVFGRPFVLDESPVDLVIVLAGDRATARRADTPDVGGVDLLGRTIPELRIAADSDVRDVLTAVRDYILRGSAAGSRIARLVDAPR